MKKRNNLFWTRLAFVVGFSAQIAAVDHISALRPSASTHSNPTHIPPRPSDVVLDSLTVSGSAELYAYLSLECPQGFVVGHVLSARYGHASSARETEARGGSIGGHASPEGNGCEDAHAAEVLHEVCVDESKCELVVTESLLGTLAKGCVGSVADLVDLHGTDAAAAAAAAAGDTAGEVGAGTNAVAMHAKAFEVTVGCKPADDFAVDGYFKQWSEVRWDEAHAVRDAEQQAVSELIASAPPYPKEMFAGRGIVMVAGGKYLRDAMVTIAMLRELGCRLRIQIWHLGAAEMPEGTEGFFEEYVVETYDILDHAHEVANIQSNVGFRPFKLKPMALLYTDLEEVLLLDADSTPMADPSFLFDDPRYVSAGTLFWEDYWKTHRENPIWDLLGLAPSSHWEQESGQMVVNKKVAWKAILLLQHFQADLYYSLLNGDKDTFRFSWMATNTSFAMNTHWPAAIGMARIKEDGFCGHTMGQHDFDGNLLFIHHNQLKIAHMAADDSSYDFFTAMKQVDTSQGTYRAIGSHGLELKVGGNDVTIPCSDIEFVRNDTDPWLRTPTTTPVHLQHWSKMFFKQLEVLDRYIAKLAIEHGPSGASDPFTSNGGAVGETPSLAATELFHATGRFRRAGGSNATVLATAMPESPITAHLDELFVDDNEEGIQAVADQLAKQYLARLGLVGVRGRRSDDNSPGTAGNPIQFVADLVRTEARRSSRRRRAVVWELQIALLNVPATTLLTNPTPPTSVCTKSEAFNNQTKVAATEVSIVKSDGTTLTASATTEISCTPVFQVETKTSTTIKAEVPRAINNHLDSLDNQVNADADADADDRAAAAAEIQAIADELAQQYAASLGLPADVKFIAKLVQVGVNERRVRQQRDTPTSTWVLVVTFLETNDVDIDVCKRATEPQAGNAFTLPKKQPDGTQLTGPIVGTDDCNNRVKVVSSAPEPALTTTLGPTVAPNSTTTVIPGP